MFLNIFLLIVGVFFESCVAAENYLTWDLQCDTRNYVTRAIGTNFSVTITSYCSNNPIDGCLMTYIFEASNNRHDYKRVDVNEAGNNGDRAEVSLDNGTINYEFRYEFRKLNENNSIMFNLIVVSSNQSHAVNLKMKGYDSCKDAFTFATINFKDCQNISAFGVVVPNSDIAQYLDYGRIVCNDGEKGGRAIFSNGSEVFETQCSAEAKWKYEDDISCLYPIIAELQIDGQQYNRTVELKYNRSNPNIEVSLACVPSGAVDATNSTTFQVGNQKINTSLSINPKFNGKNVSCYIENNYTKQFNDTHLSTSTLDIKFGPYKPPSDSSLCSSSNGSILFYSNPRSSSKILSLVSLEKVEIPSYIEDCCEINYGVEGQMITPVDKLTNRSKLHLRTNYSGTYDYYQVEFCENIAIETTITPVETTTVPTITTGTTKSYLIPIAAAVGGLTLILAIIASYLCWRRIHKGKSENINKGKIENVNPLYGTAEDVCVDTSAKEEVANPLYGTMQSAENGVELHDVVEKPKEDNIKNKSQPGISSNDLYAVVQKEGKASKGQDNSGFVALDQGGSTYAVVNKKEKRKGQEKNVSVVPDQEGDTYSVVNKKQKKLSDKKLNQTSESDIDTYAVVDRSKKKDKKGISNSNPTNASEVETYAVVDRSKKKNKK